MRVAIFFDGKNFHSGWRAQADGVRVDFPALADWLVEECGGSSLWSANYYTGVECGERADDDGQRKLSGFLNMLDTQPGYFVQRMPRREASWTCESCGAEARYTQEREVDTSLVVDMVRTAGLGAADIFVLVSGDTDHAPAIEAVRALGRQAYVATWGGFGLSGRLRCAAFDHIDLLEGLDRFTGDRGLPVGAVPRQDGFEVIAEGPLVDGVIDGGSPVNTEAHAQLVRELRRAEEWFDGGYVGLNYFLTRWKSPVLDSAPEVRRRLLHQLVDEGLVDIYEVDGATAVRSIPTTEADLH